MIYGFSERRQRQNINESNSNKLCSMTSLRHAAIENTIAPTNNTISGLFQSPTLFCTHRSLLSIQVVHPRTAANSFPDRLTDGDVVVFRVTSDQLDRRSQRTDAQTRHSTNTHCGHARRSLQAVLYDDRCRTT